MLATPMDVLTRFPVRKTKAQKQAFREAALSYARSLGYCAELEKGSFGLQNIVIGDPQKARWLLTAHYDTCARLPIPNLVTPCSALPFIGYQLAVTLLLLVPPLLLGLSVSLIFKNPAIMGMVIYLCALLELYLMFFGPANRNNANDNTSGVVTLLEIAKTLPEKQRSDVCFVLFDLEEAGLLGSGAYRKAHKQATEHQLVLNLDCVGDGDHIRLFPTKKLKKDRRRLTSLYKACGYFGPKDILIHEKGFSYYPSDQKCFPYGVGIAALRKSKFGLYLGRIHTSKDTILEETNINLLRAALISLITCGAAQ